MGYADISFQLESLSVPPRVLTVFIPTIGGAQGRPAECVGQIPVLRTRRCARATSIRNVEIPQRSGRRLGSPPLPPLVV